MRSIVTAIVVALTVAGAWVEGAEPFTVSILNAPETIPLGATEIMVDGRGVVEGWVQFKIAVEVSLLGEKVVPIVPPSFWGYRYNDSFSIYARVHDERGEDLAPCRPIAYGDLVIMGRPGLDPGWTERLDIPVCVPGVGKYVVEVVAEETASSFVNLKGETFSLWTGSSSSPQITVEVTEPEGIDKEAYEAFGRNPLGDSERFGELLGRFPTSTYAAYVMWKKTHPGTRPPKIDNNLYAMELGIGSFGPTPLPCVDPASSKCVDVGISPGGYEGARRAAAWLDLVLRHNPDIWFADELLYKSAYTAFFLGDKDACAAGLEELADHGRSDVAAKAEDLLAAMKAKGMLEEKKQ